ncbi:beta-mannanase [Arthrobacter sp. JZ12]|uniref:glycoside hydrolase family 26 protein n=1 Tax=Arthrobacter sp. JZ12 TaxID=2654190 RepID=UPI002B49B6AC|nr:glycosyl hydrolase [Arthrobacter sp. JZ12]WRH24505.1 beta-mannanase [Arthrobacter sp. JZ12]
MSAISGLNSRPRTASAPTYAPGTAVGRAAGRILLFLATVALLAVGIVPAAQAAAVVTLSSTSGEAGSTVTVTGTGFPKRTSGTVTTEGASVKVRTNGAGAFETRIAVGSGPTATITATVGGTTASATFTVIQPEPVTETETSLTGTSKAIRFGVGTNGGPAASTELDEVTAIAGEAPSIVLSYKDFNQAPPIWELDQVRARGAETLLTWEPWTWGGGVEQPAYSLDRITAGDFDDYLRQWGYALRDWGHPVYLRFGHEMNGNWYPWAEGVNGNGPGDYVAAYRHVHNVVSSTGAANIQWVWNPNVPYWGSTDLAQLFPGAEYVDLVALDGYNWGTSQLWSTWQEPDVLFGKGLSQLRAIAPGKPIMIAETASSEIGGSKAAWNRNLFAYLSAQPDVVALVWFHIHKEADWRIDSSESSAIAFREALAGRR